MDDRLFRRADGLLDRALDLPPAERSAFLERECADDPELRARVERLLGHLETEPGFLEAGGSEAGALLGALEDAEPGDGAMAGRVIGAYRVEREIGRGGMATVYLASRADGHFDQKVALKLIDRGVQGEEAMRRFARERQILAAAVHPHIARLFDGGVTPDGEPFFVMEHIEGQPIDEYCDGRRLGVEERLGLFLQAASAVAYAHRNLVVHRDIKPHNILVTAPGEVKLLDFGIAKPLDGGEDRTALTTMDSRPMTPSFASPEQIRGDAVTTAVDIWQLGVLLYLLLCGRMPHRGAAGDPGSLQRSILEEDPPRPSSLLPAAVNGGDHATAASVAEARGTTPGQLKRRLAGDLDNIILKALRKEPERRYASVQQMIEDVEGYLEGRTVSARPDTLGYRTSKFVRRHKVAVAFALTSVWLLIAFAAVMTYQAGRIARERDAARREREAARQVAALMVDLFEISDPSEARGNEVTAREILDKGAGKIRTELADQPVVRAELEDTLGRVYQNLGLYEEARPLLEEALAVRRQSLGPEHPDTILTMKNLAWLLESKGDYAGAEPLHRRVLEAVRKTEGDRSLKAASALNNLGLFLHRKGEGEEAEPLLREALAIYRDAGEGRSEGAANALSNLGLVVHHKGDLDEAGALYTESLEIRREVLGEDHPHIATSLDNLGRLAFDRGDMEEAERSMRQGLELRRRILDEDHPEIANSLSNLGSVLFRNGDLEGAEEMFVQIVEMDRRKLGEDHPDYGNSLNNLAHIRMSRGDAAGAAPTFLQALEVYRRALPADHWLIALARSNYGQCLTALKRYPEAERELLAGYEGLREAMGEDHQRTRGAAGRLADLYDAWGRPAQAARYRPKEP